MALRTTSGATSTRTLRATKLSVPRGKVTVTITPLAADGAIGPAVTRSL